MNKVRETAYRVLYRVLEEEGYSHVELARAFRREEFDKRDRSFVTRLCEGTLERLLTLDYILNSYSKTKVEKMKPSVRTVLRMSVYQILYMDAVPDSAACNEAVELIKKKGLSGLSGFVNGVLRTIVRERETVTEQSFYPDSRTEPIRFLSLYYSMPEWICREWVEAYGYLTAERMVKGCLRNPATTVRVNLSKGSKEALENRLRQQGISVTEGHYLPDALLLESFNRLESVPEFLNGWFCVQDESSMLVALAAGLRKEDFVLDVCAAPGGKALHAAELLNRLGGGTVVARDLTEAKTALIRENRDRVKCGNLRIQEWDATAPDETMTERANVVIADLPCSGLGIMAKKPEIRYRMKPENRAALVRLQRTILDTVQAYVKPGGVLVYSTCTINPAENKEQAAYLCERYGFFVESPAELLPERCRPLVNSEGMIQLLPGVHECDGFFITRLRKRNGENND